MAPAPAPKRRKTSSGFGSTKAKGIRKQQPVEELKFDPDARQEYLTGFHKRKVQRIKHAQELAAKLAREEKLEHRKEVSRVLSLWTLLAWTVRVLALCTGMG